MSFLNRNALLIIVVMFSLLLVIHTAFLVSHLVNAQEANSAIVATDNVVEDTASNTALTVITVLQGMLVASALTLVFFGTKSFLRLRGRLTSIANTLQNCNSAYIYNDLNQSTSADAAEFEQQKLSANLKKVREFVQAVSHGNYSITWEGIDERTLHANKDTIAGELLNMRDKMQNVKDEDQIRLWTTEGVSKFGEIIRKHQNNIDQLAENLISNIVTYVGAKVGGLFIVDETEGGQITLQLRASYAYERKKFISKSVEAGEGIVGQCFLEGQTVYMEKIPQNYMAITSGLGGAVPSSLLVIPLRANEKIEGVLELASLKPFKKHEIEFLEKLGELLASSIITVRTSERTTHLLQMSNEQAEEMRAQEEEMRQNMEELQATQEQMNRTLAELANVKTNLEKEKYLLDSLMDNIPDAIYFKDRDSKFIRVSKYLADHFNGHVEALIGKSDFDFQDKARAQQAFEDEKNIMTTRKPMIDYIEKEVMTDGTEHWVSTTKMPLINSKGDVVGTFGISRDVTRVKKLEQEVMLKDKNIVSELKQYEEKIKSLEHQLKMRNAS